MKVVAVALALLAPAGFVPMTERAESGQVRAEFTYLYDKTNFDFAQLHLRIQRGGAILVDKDPAPACDFCKVWPQSFGDPGASSIAVRDLDRDSEPEVLVDLNTGGAHCCEYTSFYRFSGSTYLTRTHSWGNPGYRLRDLGDDGTPEFITGDDRFNYAFSCYACSAVPIRVQRYAASGLVDVTRKFPAQIRADAARTWGFSRQAMRRHVTPAGLLPAYLADQYLLGQSKVGWKRVRAAVARPDWPRLVAADEPRWKNRARYLAAVRRFLVKTGYAR